MPRTAKPARLWLRERNGASSWVILAAGRQIATGCRAGDRAGAEARLAEHIAASYKPSCDSGRNPSQITIAEILNIYLLDRKKKLADPRQAAGRIERLISFFGEKPVSALNRRLCRDYAEHRGASQQAARRELDDLKAALGHARQEEILTISPVLELPAKSPPRERWLTRSEAAKLIWACWRKKQATRSGDNENARMTRQHIARFILVGLYTGTRSTAICEAAMGPAIGRGYVDLEQGKFYRRAPGTAETNKRQPPVWLPDRLTAHMRRWKRRGVSLRSVIEYENRPVKEIKKGFRRAVADAGLEGKITPHTLRHTAISWTLQGRPERGIRGATMHAAANYFGVSAQLIDRVYGHHCCEEQKEVGRILTGRKA